MTKQSFNVIHIDNDADWDNAPVVSSHKLQRQAIEAASNMTATYQEYRKKYGLLSGVPFGVRKDVLHPEQFQK